MARQMKKSISDGVKKVRKTFDYYDYNLVAVVVLLTCFGLVMLYSTSAYTAELKFNDDMHYFGRQAIISFVCILGMLAISQMNYHILKPLAPVLYVAAAVTMILVQTPLGVTVNGAKRWLNLGIQFQPSEIAKVAVIVCIPCMIVKMGREIGRLSGFVKLFFAGALLAFMAYRFTDNLSTGLIIGGITVALIYVAHPKSTPFYVAAVVLIIVAIAGVYYLNQLVDSSDSFRIQRILVWLKPEEYSGTNGYQILQALYAIGSGGFFGKGLGNSAQKLGAVPEAQNDMIFSIICEELGIFGAAIVLILFAYLLYRLFFIAQNAPDLFGSLMVSGIFIHISLQVILNICVVLNVIPTTGITLPFVSYGGTSIMFLMAEMAIALSVSRQIRFKEVERRTRQASESFY